MSALDWCVAAADVFFKVAVVVWIRQQMAWNRAQQRINDAQMLINAEER